MPILLGVLAFLGVAAVFCCGIGALFTMNAKSRIVAAAKNVEAENVRRQQELQRELAAQQQRAMQQAKRKTTTTTTNPSSKSASSRPGSSPNSSAFPQPTPPSFEPPPSFSPPSSPPSFTPPTAKRRPRASAMSDSERLDQVLADLKNPSQTRPVFFVLSDLEKIPIQESRRAEVSAALEPFLQGSDSSAARSALRALGVWGTEANVGSLSTLLDSSDIGLRYEAIRALPKLSKSEATAELLASKFKDFSSVGPMRDAFKELGPVGEQALLKRVEAADRPTRQAVHLVLADVGGAATRDALRELVKKETDFTLKAMAEHTLRRVESRNP